MSDDQAQQGSLKNMKPPQEGFNIYVHQEHTQDVITIYSNRRKRRLTISITDPRAFGRSRSENGSYSLAVDDD